MSGDTRPQCEKGQTPAGFIRTFTRGCRLPYAAFNCAVFRLGSLRIDHCGAACACLIHFHGSRC